MGDHMGARLIAWGLVMVAVAVASSVGLLARPARPTEGEYIYLWGCALLDISGIMFIVDYLRSWTKDKS